ncbi:MAG: LLM class flavin-dependent oxidoreductase, partial [Actinomycetota bacterium]
MAEDTGYEAVFVPEISGREAFSTLAGFATATTRIGLGTGVVTIPSRSPVTSAMAAATVHDLSGGRAVLGVGAGDVRA